MARFIYLKTEAAQPLATELTERGYPTEEVLSVAEVRHMLAEERIDVVIIAADFNHPDAAVIRQHIMTMKLKPEATYKDVISEWLFLQPSPTTLTQ